MRVLSRVVLSVLTAGALVAPVATTSATAVAPTAATTFRSVIDPEHAPSQKVGFTPHTVAAKRGTEVAITNLDESVRTFTLRTASGAVYQPLTEVRVLPRQPGMLQIPSDVDNDTYYATAYSGTFDDSLPKLTIRAV